jgi:hypothetical protein
MKFFEQKEVVIYNEKKRVEVSTAEDLIKNGVIMPLPVRDTLSLYISDERVSTSFTYKDIKYDAHIIRDNAGAGKYPHYEGWLFSVNDIPVYFVNSGDGNYYFNEDKGLLICTSNEFMAHIWFDDMQVVTFHMEGGYIMYPRK